MLISFARYYEEVSLKVSTTGSRPAILIEKIDSELYHDRNTTKTYRFRVKNSDSSAQSQVKLQYTLEFHMPVSTGITYSLQKESAAVPLQEAGTAADGKKIYTTAAQKLGLDAQTDTFTLTAVNSDTRSIAILDTMEIMVHSQQDVS